MKRLRNHQAFLENVIQPLGIAVNFVVIAAVLLSFVVTLLASVGSLPMTLGVAALLAGTLITLGFCAFVLKMASAVTVDEGAGERVVERANRASVATSVPPAESTSIEEPADVALAEEDTVIDGELFAQVDTVTDGELFTEEDTVIDGELFTEEDTVIDGELWNELCTFLDTLPATEQGGVLLGFREDGSDGKKRSRLTAAVFPQQLRASSTICEFSTEDIDTIRSVIFDLENQGIEGVDRIGIMTWIHTHPNMSVFLSDTDCETLSSQWASLDPDARAVVVDVFKSDVEEQIGVFDADYEQVSHAVGRLPLNETLASEFRDALATAYESLGRSCPRVMMAHEVVRAVDPNVEAALVPVLKALEGLAIEDRVAFFAEIDRLKCSSRDRSPC